MNNQPKFKKGDRVRDIKQAITGEIVKFSDFYKEWIILTTSGRKTTSNEKDLQLLPFPAPDMLAIPDDHVWPVTSDNEVVIVDELFEKQKESFIKAATSMTGSATLTPEFKAFGEFATKLDSVDQELEDAFKDLYKDTYHTAWEHLNNPIHPLYGAFLNFKAGANWKAEQVANDAIQFADWCEDNYWPTAQTGKWRAGISDEDELLTTKELYELWQENQKRSTTL